MTSGIALPSFTGDSEPEYSTPTKPISSDQNSSECSTDQRHSSSYPPSTPTLCWNRRIAVCSTAAGVGSHITLRPAATAGAAATAETGGWRCCGTGGAACGRTWSARAVASTTHASSAPRSSALTTIAPARRRERPRERPMQAETEVQTRRSNLSRIFPAGFRGNGTRGRGRGVAQIFTSHAY